MLNMNKVGFFPYTPATLMLGGLVEGIAMLHEEGLDNVFARHDRLAEGVRRAVKHWGLEIICRDPKYYSSTVTAILMPEGHDGDAFRALALDTFNISYGASFGRFAGKYVPHRPSRRHQRRHHHRRAGGNRNGAVARRRSAQEGRRAGGDGLFRLGACRTGAGGGGVVLPHSRSLELRGAITRAPFHLAYCVGIFAAFASATVDATSSRKNFAN